MKEEDKYLDRLGVCDELPKSHRDDLVQYQASIFGLNHFNIGDLRMLGVGNNIETQCSWADLLEHLRGLHMTGHIKSLDINIPSPQSIPIRGHIVHMPTLEPPEITMVLHDDNRVEFAVERWDDENVIMMLTSWELGYGRVPWR